MPGRMVILTLRSTGILKKRLILSILAWGVALAAQAQTPPAAASSSASGTAQPAVYKLGVINIQAAILQTSEGKQAAEAMRAKYDARGQALQKRSADLQAKIEQSRKGGATMTDEARAKLMRDNDAENKALQRDQEDLNADIEQDQGKLSNDLGNKVFEIVQQYAAANGIVMVLDVSSQQTPILWHHPATDITADIIKLYDQAHPAAAKPAAAKPAAAPPAAKK